MLDDLVSPSQRLDPRDAREIVKINESLVVLITELVPPDFQTTRAKLLVPIDGDVTGDKRIDVADFAILAGCLSGPASAPDVQCLAADINKDGTVDLADFWSMQSAMSAP